MPIKFFISFPYQQLTSGLTSRGLSFSQNKKEAGPGWRVVAGEEPLDSYSTIFRAWHLSSHLQDSGSVSRLWVCSPGRMKGNGKGQKAKGQPSQRFLSGKDGTCAGAHAVAFPSRVMATPCCKGVFTWHVVPRRMPGLSERQRGEGG